MLYRVIKRLASVWSGEYLAFGGEDGGKGEEVGETRRWERCKNWSGLERDCEAACSQSKEIGGANCTVEYTSRAGKSHGKKKDNIGKRNLNMNKLLVIARAQGQGHFCKCQVPRKGRACGQYISTAQCVALTGPTHPEY